MIDVEMSFYFKNNFSNQARINFKSTHFDGHCRTFYIIKNTRTDVLPNAIMYECMFCIT
jgi:hypothetical protein